MDSSNDEALADPSSKVLPPLIKKNKRGKIIRSRERLKIVDLYKAYLEKDPKMTIRTMRRIISKSMGIGESTVSRTINEYKLTNTVTSPKRKRKKENVFNLYDQFAKNAVCRHIHNIWIRREIPTVDKIHKEVSDDNNLPVISRSSLYRLIKELKILSYIKRGQTRVLTEKNKIVLQRRQYLRTLRKYREEGRHIYYLGVKVWIRAHMTSHCDAFPKGLALFDSSNSCDKADRIIVLHIGSENGFVSGAFLCFESKKGMDGQVFHKWMENILPALQDNSVIVMNNEPYNSVKKDKAPTWTTTRADIINWLESKIEIQDNDYTTMVIPELLDFVKQIKPYLNVVAVDELAQANNKTILRIPPYHHELNPIELAWSSVNNHIRTNITSYKIFDIKKLLIKGIEQVDTEMWKNYIHHTKNEENKFWEIDNIIDEVMTQEMPNLTLTITGDISSDSMSESESD